MILKKFIFTLFIIHFSTLIASAQVQQEWVRRYDDSAHLNDISWGIGLDRPGNIYVTGIGNQTGTGGGPNITTIKYTPNGIQQWVAVYYDNTDNNFAGIAVDSAGNSYVRCTTGNFINDHVSFLLLKYNTNGVLQWARTYGDGNHAFYAEDLIIDKQGNIYEVGSTNAYGDVKVFVVKYTPNGDTIWSRRYEYPGYTLNYAFSIAIDSSNNLIIAGSCSPFVGASGDCLVIKYSSSGNFLWSSIYDSGFNTNDYFNKVGVDLNNNIYATGGTGYWVSYVTIKYNSSGVEQWIRTYGGTLQNSVNEARSLVIDKQGFVYITGVVQDSITGYDVATIKYNSSGDTLWTRIFDTQNHSTDGGNDIALDNSGNLYVNGSTDSGNGNSLTMKYNNDGILQWVMSYPGGSTIYSKSIVIDNSADVYVLGNNYLSSYDYITIKYSQLNGITPISNETPKTFELFQNYPNPFNPTTNIKFDIPTPLVPPLAKGGMTQPGGL